MTRLISLLLMALLSLSLGVVMAQAGPSEGVHDQGATEDEMCMDCHARMMACEVCSANLFCDACTDHMKTCAACASGEMCEMGKAMMEEGCEECMAKWAAFVPCVNCAKGIFNCSRCMGDKACDLHQAAIADCEVCAEGTLCANCKVAMGSCDACMANVLCADHIEMARNCEICKSGDGPCDDCMKAALGCQACGALWNPALTEAAETAEAIETTDTDVASAARGS